MASYTQELGWLLRGFSDFNDKPQLFASPHSVIENSYKRFFKAVGDYSFKLWGDERDQAFQEQFEKNLLEFFYMKEYGYQTPDAFILQLGSFLRRKMPVFCRHWRAILDEMYITSTGNITGNTVGTSINNDKRTTDSWGDSKNHNETTTDTNSIVKGAALDTPLEDLDIDMNNPEYASMLNKTDTNTNSKSISDTENNYNDHSMSVGNATGNTTSNNTTDNYARNKDVFDIYDQWISSGYDLFTPLYKEMMNEQLFVIFN